MSAQASAPARQLRGYDLAQTAVERLRKLEAPMSPLNFELWFMAVENPTGALAKELARIAHDRVAVSEELSQDLAGRYLPSHRLAKEARESEEALVDQLAAVDRTVSAVQANQRGFGQTVTLGAVALGQTDDPAAIRQLIQHLRTAASAAQAESDRLGAQLQTSVSEVKRLREHMEVIRREALTDSLTGLPNRKAFDDALAKAIAAGGDVSVALIDVDHFKRFNDTWGHATGDQVLRFVGSMISRVGYAPRMAARYGGEEFAVLFHAEPRGKAVADLRAMQDQIRGRVLTRRTTGEALGVLTVSVGLASRGRESAEALLARADEALYTSKNEGRDRLSLAPQAHAALKFAS